MRHELKTWPAAFEALVTGRKTFEYRHDDREYAVGDTLVLREYDPATQQLTGRTTLRVVTYILRGDFGVPEGYAVLAVRRQGWRPRT